MSNEITKKSINVKRNFATFSVHLQVDEAKKKKMSNL
jgi:hypothetical protein